MSADMSIEQIRARLEAATPGPWLLRDCPPCTEWGRMDVFIWGADRESLIAHWCDDDPFDRPDAEFIAHAPTDVAALLKVADSVLALHRPAKIYDECECPDGTHPEGYDYFDCADYVGCENSLIGIGCEECCIDGDYLSEDCGENHSHTLDADKRCPTVAAVTAALEGK